MSQFELSEPAKGDLRAIWLDVAADSDRRADKVIDYLLDVCDTLARNPKLGEVWGSRHPGLRFFPAAANKYVMFFLPTDFGVQIVRVIHGHRDLANLIPHE